MDNSHTDGQQMDGIPENTLSLPWILWQKQKNTQKESVEVSEQSPNATAARILLHRVQLK